MWDYKALPQPCCAVTNLDQEAASYCYNLGTRLFISFDTPEIARKKGEYIKSKGLGGGIWWELSDDKQGDGNLIILVTLNFAGCKYRWRHWRSRKRRKSTELSCLQLRQPEGLLLISFNLLVGILVHRKLSAIEMSNYSCISKV